MGKSKQSGAVLAVSLVMLGVLTLLGVAAIGLGTTNLRQVGNMQARKNVEMATQSALETFISSAAPFVLASCDPRPQTVTVNGTAVTVDLDEPRCLSTMAAGMPSDDTGLLFDSEDDAWEVRATGRDPLTGSTVILHQGVTVRQSVNNCPDVPTTAACP